MTLGALLTSHTLGFRLVEKCAYNSYNEVVKQKQERCLPTYQNTQKALLTMQCLMQLFKKSTGTAYSHREEEIAKAMGL